MFYSPGSTSRTIVQTMKLVQCEIVFLHMPSKTDIFSFCLERHFDYGRSSNMPQFSPWLPCGWRRQRFLSGSQCCPVCCCLLLSAPVCSCLVRCAPQTACGRFREPPASQQPWLRPRFQRLVTSRMSNCKRQTRCFHRPGPKPQSLVNVNADKSRRPVGCQASTPGSE